MKYQRVRKIISFISSLSLVFQSFLPLTFALPVYAEGDATESAVVEQTITPEVTPEVTPEITPEITPAVEPTPEITPEVTPTLDPTPEISPTPEITPEVTPEITPEITPEATPTVEPTPEEVQNNSPPAETQSSSESVPSEPTPETTLPEDLTVVAQLQQTITPEIIPTLSTDKADYFPTDTVYITGVNFLPNTTYILNISSQDNPIFNYKPEVTSDENGNISFFFTLDGNYRPNYKIEAIDTHGNTIVTYTFTDSGPIADAATFAELNTALADVSVSSINITADITGISSSILVGRAVTIEGNGYTFFPTFTKTSDSNNATFIITSSNVTLRNLTVDGTSGTNLHGINVYTSTNVLLDTVSVINNDYGGIIVNGSVVTVKDINTSGNGWYGINIDQGTGVTSEARLIISGASLHGDTNHIYIDDNRKGSVTDTTPNQYDVTNDGGHARIYTLIAIPAATVSISWPTTWNTPNSCVSDPVNDESPSSTDLIGIPGTPAVGFNSDSNYQYFRERVDGNPAGPGGFDQFAWVTIFQTTGTQYQYLASVNGVAEKVQLYQNTTPAGDVDFNPLLNDPAETLLWEGDSFNYARITTGSDGKKYVEWAIPLTELTSRGITSSTTKFFATSANANNYNKDHLQCYEAFADLSVIKTDSPDPVVNGGTLTYTLAIHNAGPDSASGVIVTDTLPSGYVVSSVTPSQGTCSDITAPSISCELGTIANSGDASIIIVGIITTTATTVTNTASVNLDTTVSIDLNLTNNTDTEDTDINPNTGILTVQKTTNPSGDTTSFSITASSSTGGTITGGGAGSVTDSTNQVYTVTPGTYSVTENVTAGWIQTGNTCTNVAVAAGESKTCQITNTKNATLHVIKTVINNNGGTKTASDFSFQLNGGSATAFESDGQNDLSVTPGLTNNITEPTVSGYTTSYQGCSNVIISAGGEATCTITNDDIAPKLHLRKTIINDNGGTATVSNFTLTADGTGTNDLSGISPVDSTDSLKADTFLLSESIGAGYDSSNWVCTGGTQNGNNITLGLNEEATCTITNNDIPPKLHLRKIVINDNGGNATPANWTLTADGTTTNDFSGTTPVDSGATLQADTFILSESGPSGYSSSSWNCTDPGLGGTIIDGNSIRLYIGGESTCTITNDDKASYLVVHKTTFPAGDTTEFSILASGTGSVSDAGVGKIKDVTDHTYEVTPGTFSVTESETTGWKEILNTCRGIEIKLGETKECTITNEKYGSVSGYKYQVNSDSSLVGAIPGWYIYLSDGVTTLSTTTNSSGYYLFSNLLHGIYTLSEESRSDHTPIYSPSDVTLDSGEVEEDKNFGNFRNGSIFGVKFEDKNGNGIMDGDEGYLSGWKIFLDEDGDGIWDEGETFTNTTNSGYSLPNLGPGTYSVCEVEKADWSRTYPASSNCQSITVAISSTGYNANFGNRMMGKITIIKDSLPNSSQDFAFTGDLGGFILDDDDDNTRSNSVSFDVGSGTYTVTESEIAGWKLTDLSCTDSDNIDISQRSATVTINTPGEEITCTFYNSPNGTIHGYKWGDEDGNGNFGEGEDRLSGWTINLYDWNVEERGFNSDPIKTMVTDSGVTHFGWYWFENLFPGRYKVCEESQNGWSQTYPDPACHLLSLPDGNSNDFEISQNSTYGPEYNFGNVELAKLTVYKFQDDNQDGYRDTGEGDSEKLLSGWDIKLGQVEGTTTTQTTGTDGSTTFTDIFPGSYNLSETIKDGWFQSNIYCPQEEIEDNENNLRLRFGAGDDIVCYVGNYTNPEFQISKFNNASSDKTPGDSVTYRILINILDADVNNLVVKDLLPKGFTYRSGSYQVKINGLIVPITEPVYASPGTWNIGNVNNGDEIELLYIADISSDQQPGTYPDVASAVGTSLSDEKVIALAQSDGYLDTNFVGTEVNVVKDQTNGGNYDVENIVEGQVLGASTTLPATGASPAWLILAFVSLVYGTRLIRSANKK